MNLFENLDHYELDMLVNILKKNGKKSEICICIEEGTEISYSIELI